MSVPNTTSMCPTRVKCIQQDFTVSNTREMCPAQGRVLETVRVSQGSTRKVDVRLPGKVNSNSQGARPVHLIITMIKLIRASKLSIQNSLSSQGTRPLANHLPPGRGDSPGGELSTFRVCQLSELVNLTFGTTAQYHFLGSKV